MLTNDLSTYLAGHLDGYLDDLRLLSGIDCGTHNKAGVDRVGAWVLARCAANGWATRVHPRPKGGDIVEATIRDEGSRRLLLLAHMDTVYPDGVAAARPVRIDGDTLLGPGTADMKAGLLAGIHALEALQAVGRLPFGEVVYLFTADEETGSVESRSLIEETARACDAALVLEAARASGAIVGARKGVWEYELRVQGRSAHAGVEPEKGRNALLELAHKIVALQGLNGEIPAVTVNVGVASGGTATNVVPDAAIAHVEARAFDPEGLRAIDARIRAIAAIPTVPDTTIELSVRKGFPPMPRTAATEQLAAMAASIAAELGFSLEAVSTGGASDASLVAGAGVPVVDGLGPIGGDDHSPREWIAISSIVPRVALLASLIARVSTEGVLVGG
ncbi:MAG TPA: M20 family metallopeptidase [Chloroflexota bacterium]|nr:M20 family metallopeptidase [Chloroflexota bacterium]